MNHTLEKQPYQDFDGRKKTLSISDTKTNSDQKFAPTLKLSRKAIFASPPGALHMYIKTGNIDQLSQSVTYQALTPSYSRPSKTLLSISVFESCSSNGLLPQLVVLYRGKHEVNVGSCKVSNYSGIRFALLLHDLFLTKSTLNPQVLIYQGQKYVFMTSMMPTDGAAHTTPYEYCVIV